MGARPEGDRVLRVEDRGRVRLLTLDRPDALNAFDDALYDAVRDALADAAGAPSVACVVITGAGRAFSAGQDLGELGEPRVHDDGAPHGFGPFIEVVESFPKPLVAAVNGLGVGIGLTILPHCDLVLMSEGARLRAPFVRLGVTVEAGNSLLLPQRVGWQEAAHALFTSEWIDARQAEAIGLAWKVCAPEALLDEALAVAQKIAAMPIASLVATKRLMLDARLDAVRAARLREGPTFAGLVGGPANREAMRAFREKRDPDFTRLPAE
ncbi:MAG: enoyl-CoA hydratase-related protein [Acidimicrobiia bacterium]|nr:enoyl-CoA hydratase-related protein [Acidimicrobiia bacterium]